MTWLVMNQEQKFPLAGRNPHLFGSGDRLIGRRRLVFRMKSAPLDDGADVEGQSVDDVIYLIDQGRPFLDEPVGPPARSGGHRAGDSEDLSALLHRAAGRDEGTAPSGSFHHQSPKGEA